MISGNPSLKRSVSLLMPILLFMGLIFSAWKGMCAITGSTHPVMVVSSESMEPALYRGDLILLWNRQEEVKVGDIPVVWFPGRRLPMVHRAITVLNQSDDDRESTSRQLILTKGDNCQFDDSFFYPVGRAYVHREEIIGLVWGHIPYIGRVTLMLSENPAILYPAVATLIAVGLLG
ncbi:Peptidase S24/S26A/S26B [Penicillium italicum]|uniref:Signal peptidase complex catalytic subunit SEC11 n=1 Tax=Penicillium italicum TaxID=40296 RepID=A0A0A2LF17_PENIT|nr:Peptidase S24/S26A/S26B [Penicillium italicum]